MTDSLGDLAIIFTDDLMFVSRVREAARADKLEVRAVRSVADLLEACRTPPRVVIVDLDSQRVAGIDAVAALRNEAPLADVPIVGFFEHVHPERAREAKSAGCSRVLPRSAFVQHLPTILGNSEG